MAKITEEEIVATIMRSNLPTVVVEGKSDVRIYRRLESWLGATSASFLECGGRARLLSIYRRRSEFADKRVCFVADKDMWVFTGTPQDYQHIILTEGYSIENDLYFDSEIEHLLSPEERPNHRTMIQELARWFAREVEKYLGGLEYCTNPNLHLLIPLPSFTCCPNELAKLGFVEPSDAMREKLTSHYKLWLRGKLLYKVLARFLSASDRAAKHSNEALIEISLYGARNGSLLTRLIQSIRTNLEERQLPLPLVG